MADAVKPDDPVKQSFTDKFLDLSIDLYGMTSDFMGSMEFLTVIVILVAVWGVVSQRQISRRKSTLDYITRQESDRDVIVARREFIRLVKANGGLAEWAKVENESRRETQSIKITLNELELISIGIQYGVIDESMYRAWFKTSVVTFWHSSASFVHELRNRTDNKKLYAEFEALAKWMSEEKPRQRNFFIGRFF